MNSLQLRYLSSIFHRFIKFRIVKKSFMGQTILKDDLFLDLQKPYNNSNNNKHPTCNSNVYYSFLQQKFNRNWHGSSNIIFIPMNMANDHSKGYEKKLFMQCTFITIRNTCDANFFLLDSMYPVPKIVFCVCLYTCSVIIVLIFFCLACFLKQKIDFTPFFII